MANILPNPINTPWAFDSNMFTKNAAENIKNATDNGFLIYTWPGFFSPCGVGVITII